jgi:hypothetical protein
VNRHGWISAGDYRLMWIVGLDEWEVQRCFPLFLPRPRREFKPTTREGVVFFGGDDCALVIERAPALGSCLPNGGATGETLNLAQRASKKVGVRAEAAKSVVVAMPARSNCIDGRILFQSLQDEVTAVAAP